MPFVLSFHASYRCRQTGVCCDAGWPIPVEVDRLHALRAAMSSGHLRPRTDDPAFESPENAPAETPARLARPGGTCTFFDRGSPSSCRVHASIGHDALPLACRQFPRVTLHDPRGASVTLSHFCPTAAALLDSDAPVAIVTDAAGFPAGGHYVGLDARKGLPPLLRPVMAMDWESWWEFERRAVDRLGNGTGDLDEDLARLRGAVEAVRTWTQSDGPLLTRVGQAFNTAPAFARRLDHARLHAEVVAAIPDDLRVALPAPTATPTLRAPARRRFLAAHAFASWTAHLGLDLRAWLRSIEAADALAGSGHSPADADLLLRHLVDPHELARTWSDAARA